MENQIADLQEQLYILNLKKKKMTGSFHLDHAKARIESLLLEWTQHHLPIVEKTKGEECYLDIVVTGTMLLDIDNVWPDLNDALAMRYADLTKREGVARLARKKEKVRWRIKETEQIVGHANVDQYEWTLISGGLQGKGEFLVRLAEWVQPKRAGVTQ